MEIYLNILTLLLGCSTIFCYFTGTLSKQDDNHYIGFYGLALITILMMFVIHIMWIWIASACVGMIFTCTLIPLIVTIKSKFK